MIIREHAEAVEGGQTLTMLGWRVLLGFLADREAERLGMTASRDEVEATARAFRRDFELPRREDVEGFLRFAGLDLAGFSAQMRTFSQLARVQAHHAAEIEARLPGYLAFLELERWHALRGEEG